MALSPGPVLLPQTDHCIMQGPKAGKRHQVMVTYGCTSDKQKRPIFTKMVTDERHFVDKPSIELWVDSKLVGLCALEVGQDDVEPEDAHLGVYYHATLHAVIIKKSKRGMGFAQHLTTAAAEILTNQVLDFMSQDGVKTCTVMVQADFVSTEGEAFYFDMADKAQDCFTAYNKIMGRKVEMVLDAGF